MYIKCSKCQKEKTNENFYKRNNPPFRLIQPCKECQKLIVKKWVTENKETRKTASTLWRKKNLDKCSKNSLNAYYRNKELILKKQHEYYQKNLESSRERSRISSKKYRENNKELCNEKVKRCMKKNISKTKERQHRYYLQHKENKHNWCIANPEKIKKTRIKHYQKIKNDPKFKLASRIRSGILKSIKSNKNGRHWETIVGYTVEQLKKYIEKQFLDGMSWEDTADWEIDHIIPVSAFNFSSPDHIDFKKCWNLNNLRPLWKTANRSKGNKLKKPFQPSLALNF